MPPYGWWTRETVLISSPQNPFPSIVTKRSAAPPAVRATSTRAVRLPVLSITLRLAEHPVVSQRVPTRLGEDGEAVRPAPDPDPLDQPPRPGADRVHLGVVATGQPEDAAVDRHAAHVRAASARKPPLVDRPARIERDHRDRALAPVGDVEEARVAAGVEAMRPEPRPEQPAAPERLRVSDPDAVRGPARPRADAPVR